MNEKPKGRRISNWKTIGIIDDNGNVTSVFRLNNLGRLENKFPKAKPRLNLMSYLQGGNKKINKQKYVLSSDDSDDDSYDDVPGIINDIVINEDLLNDNIHDNVKNNNVHQRGNFIDDTIGYETKPKEQVPFIPFPYIRK